MTALEAALATLDDAADDIADEAAGVRLVALAGSVSLLKNISRFVCN